MIGKLEPESLRELWKHEALNFTSWLAENCDVLNDQLGLDLTVIETEKSVGPFSADIFAKDAAGRLVIIAFPRKESWRRNKEGVRKE